LDAAADQTPLIHHSFIPECEVKSILLYSAKSRQKLSEGTFHIEWTDK